MSHYAEIMAKADAVKSKANEAALAVRAEYARTHSGVPAPAPVPVPPIDLGVGYPPAPGEIPQINEIRSHFLWLADRDPTQISSKRSTLVAGKTAFKYTDQNAFGGMASEIQDGWDGDTAETFREQFLGKLTKAYELQMDLMDELTAALNMSEQVIYDSKRDVLDIADKTIHALEIIRQTAEAPPDSKGVMFAVIGGAVLLTGAVVTGGTASVAFAIVSSGVSVSAAAVKEGGSKPAASGLTINGGTVGQVLDSMFTAIGKVEEHDSDRCDSIADALKTDDAATESRFDQLSPPRPKVCDGMGDMSPGRD